MKKKFYRNSILCGFLITAIIWQTHNEDSYYYWFYNNLIKSNFELIFTSSKKLTDDQKNEIKLGQSYSFLKLTKESTPNNAVILFPDISTFQDNSNHVKFNGYMNRKGYLSYFLYPRQVVFERDKGNSPMYNKVTHVAIVNNWGYHKVDYNVENKLPYSVLPISKSSQKNRLQ